MSLAAADVLAFDDDAAEAFSERAADILNSAAVALGFSLGHRTGLFDTMAKLPPSTSAEIAEAAELSERYVREWLAVMVTGRVVTYDPAKRTYLLPAEHAAWLTRGSPYGNLAVYGQFVAMFGAVQDHLLEHFEHGGGISYDDYPHFHQIMAQDSGQTVTAQLFDTVLPLADGIVERLEAGIDVLDAGCGRGSALIAMAGRFPASRFVGYDLGADAIAFADKTARAAGLTNIRFEARDLTGYGEKERFDFITSFDAVHDQGDPQGLLFGLHGALKPGGVYLMQDIGGSAHLENNLDFPLASFLYAASLAHCTPVSLAQGGPGLGTMWGWETAQAMLEKAGFQGIKRTVLPHDPMNVWFVARKD